MKKSRIICFTIAILTTQAIGAPAGFWDDLMRAGSKGDEAVAAAARAERVAGDLARGNAARGAVSREVGDAADASARARSVRTLLNATLHQPDPALLRRIDALAPQEMEAALVLARGSRRMIDVVPDVATRGRLLREGGADLVAAAGLHGDELAREAAHLDALVAAGQLSARIADQAALARFAEVMRAGDGGAWTFWKTYVAPHWKKWAAGGTLVVYLANPEFFHDGAGKVTEEGARRMTVFLGKIAEGGAKGAAEGGKAAVRGVWQRFSAHYLHGPDAWMSWVGLGVVCWILGILLPRTRRWCIAPLKWFFRKPKSN